ncbi:Protein of unknown function [Pyronema omphalodes CBS 100304]|uniref:Uncharacterized protein n=1 Tax=Pyronema omphalodes (strain CBS 100304) TaxID=1076935 RepID=U4LNR7_PYROM|nr:Protein of unknown function [Pyronema omphalodes CBS 100304]
MYVGPGGTVLTFVLVVPQQEFAVVATYMQTGPRRWMKPESPARCATDHLCAFAWVNAVSF